MTRGCFKRFFFPSIFKRRVRFKSVAMLSKLWMFVSEVATVEGKEVV